MNAKQRRQQQRTEVKALILDAARAALIEDGFESLSMRKLAQRIEYSPGTIYLYFSDKDDLLHCLVEESFARLLEVLRAIPAQKDPVEWLRQGLRAYVEFGLQNPNHYKFAFVVRAAADRPWKPHPAFEALRAGVARCLEQKRFRAGDAETISQGLWATIHGVTSLLIARPGFPWVNKNRLIDHVIDTALRGLRDAPAASHKRGRRRHGRQ